MAMLRIAPGYAVLFVSAPLLGLSLVMPILAVFACFLAGATALASALIAWLAYRRWLVADFD
jgi:hypothetical protein